MEEIIKNVESYRQRIMNRFSLQALMAGGFGVVLIALSQAGMVAGLVFFGLAMIYAYNSNQFTKFAKDKLYHEISKSKDDVTIKQGGFDKGTVRSSKMLKRGDSFTSRDMIRIKNDQADVRSAYVKITETRGSGKNRRTYTLFKGTYLVFLFDHKIDGRHHIEESSSIFFKGRGDFRFEDQAFMDKFSVNSDDDLELFKLLTPRVIELLKDIERSHPGKIQFCFFYNQLHVSIYDNKDPLSMSLFTKIDSGLVGSILQEIQDLERFVEETQEINDKFMAV